MANRVCKFGGTSMANAAAIRQVVSIVMSDASRKYVVVSAPGKREKNDTKVTDLLYEAYDKFTRGGFSVDDCLKPVRERFNGIIKELNIPLNFQEEYTEIERRLEDGGGKDYIASRGEYLAGKLIAFLLGYDFVDAADIVKFDEDGLFMPDYTQDLAHAALKKSKKAVVAGFYGALPDGTIKTFARGGSDISGAIVARAVMASVYENWTDVSGFMLCDPRIVDSPRKISILTYKELRELSYMGANVLHPDSIFPVRKADIPINIRNTFEPENSGTLIVPTKQFQNKKYVRPHQRITGIAGKKDFFSINIEKSMLNSEMGAVRKLLTVLEYYNVSFEHLPTGIDTISVVIDKTLMDMGKLPMMMDAIRLSIMPDSIEIADNLALIAVVGHGMLSYKGTAAKVFSALASREINIKMIDQGSSELNIIVGVESSDYENAIRVLYDTFF